MRMQSLSEFVVSKAPPVRDGSASSFDWRVRCKP